MERHYVLITVVLLISSSCSRSYMLFNQNHFSFSSRFLAVSRQRLPIIISSWLLGVRSRSRISLPKHLKRDGKMGFVFNYSLSWWSKDVYILSINKKLPLTRVHLTQEQIWIFLYRELPSVQLPFLWCTVLRIGTTENGVRHTWIHDSLSLMNTRCFHWVLWELAKW